MFWLTGRWLVSKGVSVPVAFGNVSGLKEGDPVRVSGVKKGRVGQVRLERVGRVTVMLELDPEVRPHKDATATVVSADFLGAKFVDYNPGTSDTLLGPGGKIAGVTEEQFADIAQRAATGANELIAKVNKGLNPGQLANDIHNTLLATQRGMNALTQATNGPAVHQAPTTLRSPARPLRALSPRRRSRSRALRAATRSWRAGYRGAPSDRPPYSRPLGRTRAGSRAAPCRATAAGRADRRPPGFGGTGRSP